jgi:catecholate siderophore receptor
LLHDGQRVLNVDAGVYAQIDATWKAQLNIENIFNKGYCSADGNNNISPGQPRTFRGPAPRRGTPRPFCD